MPSLTHEDSYIDLLKELDSPLGRLVKLYKENPSTFKTDWIKNESLLMMDETLVYNNAVEIPEDFINCQEKTVQNYNLLNLELAYFRGVRNKQVVNLSNKITIFYGGGSHGKTTLAEAIEWLFTGELSRYESNSTGEPSELKDCIKNKLSSSEDETYVSADIFFEGQIFRLKRILINDYNGIRTSKCETQLIQNGMKLEEKDSILKSILVGKPPVLMQHVIGDFIRNKPEERAKYFESIFGVEDLSELIRLAIISQNEIDNIYNPQTGNEYCNILKNLAEMDCRELLSISKFEDLPDLDKLKYILVSDIKQISLFKYLLTENKEIYEIVENITSIIENSLIKDLPKDTLVPQRNIAISDQVYFEDFKIINDEIEKLNTLISSYEKIETSLSVIDEKHKILYETIKILKDNDLINPELELQDCPLCNTSKALRIDRITTIEEIKPIQDIINEVFGNKRLSLEKIKNELNNIKGELFALLPSENNIEENSNKIFDDFKINEYIKGINPLLEKSWDNVIDLKQTVATICELIDTDLANQQMDLKKEDLKLIIEKVQNITKKFIKVFEQIHSYQKKYKELNDYLSQKAISDTDIKTSKQLIKLLQQPSLVLSDLKWIIAKRIANGLLIRIRGEKLIPYRQEVIKSKEDLLNNGIKKVWQVFRDDTSGHTIFEKIELPPPSGQGYRPKIDVVAKINGKELTKEATALNVFTESQVNLLGFAAFITRCDIENQPIYILDDPLQSMDDYHFEKFSKDFLEYILQTSVNLIVFTHSQTVSRLIRTEHQFNPNIFEYRAECTKKIGAAYKPSENYILTALENVANLIDDGQSSQLEEAVTKMRTKILEPFYKYLCVKHCGCSITSTEKVTIETMIKNMGLGEYFKNNCANQVDKLKRIQDFLNSSNGPHDGIDRTQEHVNQIFKDLKSIINEIKEIIKQADVI